MATVKIWPVKHHLQRSIAYIMKPEKTGWQGRALVSGVDVSVDTPETACAGMEYTKAMFEKAGGRLAYHMEQAFKPGEVSPETAHEIGGKLARELWGRQFEVVVATHVDKNHIHNHFISAPIRDRVNPLSKRQA